MTGKAEELVNDPVDTHLLICHRMLEETGKLKITDVEKSHAEMDSMLHYSAGTDSVNGSAFFYAAMRLPACIHGITSIIIGSDSQSLKNAGYNVYEWKEVQTRGRRRKTFYDQKTTLGVHISSISDMDDLITLCTVFQIEWNKIHKKLQEQSRISPLLMRCYACMSQQEQLRMVLGISREDWKLFEKLYGENLIDWISCIKGKSVSFTIYQVRQTVATYQDLAHQWVDDILSPLSDISSSTPVYLVSANIYSISSLITGFLYDEDKVIDCYSNHYEPDIKKRLHDLFYDDDDIKIYNFLYYCLFHHPYHSDDSKRRASKEASAGIIRQNSSPYIDLQSCIIPICTIPFDNMDSRIHVSDPECLKNSDAFIIIFDYPLGFTAYHLLTAFFKRMKVRGVYVFGKAGTLQNRIGDIIIPGFVHDTFSMKNFIFDNCFSAEKISRLTSWTAVLKHQKAVTVKGTILQNSDRMRAFHHEGYNSVEMEAGPYLSAIVDHFGISGQGDGTVIIDPFIDIDVGMIHYASDVLFNRRDALLSYEGWYSTIDSNYASSIATLEQIFERERQRLLS